MNLDRVQMYQQTVEDLRQLQLQLRRQAVYQKMHGHIINLNVRLVDIIIQQHSESAQQLHGQHLHQHLHQHLQQHLHQPRQLQCGIALQLK